MNASLLSELTRRLADISALEPDLLRQDLENNIRAVLQSTLGKLDLVTREEFDIQSQVLQRTRQQLKALEKRVMELERKPD